VRTVSRPMPRLPPVTRATRGAEPDGVGGAEPGGVGGAADGGTGGGALTTPLPR
jgi:hypothetical protein